MTNYYHLFKNDFFNGITALTKTIWKKVLWAYAIYYGCTMVLAGMVALVALLGVSDMSMFADMLSGSTPEDSLLMLEHMAEMFLTPEFIVSMIVFMLIIIVIASWNYYFAFLTADSEIKDEQLTFAQLFKLSFSSEVFKLVLITIVLNILIALMFFAAVFSASLSGILALLLFITAMVVSMRFLLVMPAYVIGNYDFSSSFAFSFYHINWSRAFKFLGICFLAFLVIFGVSLIVGLVTSVFSLIPVIGFIVQMAVNVVFGAIMMAITVAALVGLYYRYADAPKESTDAAELTTTIE